MKPYRVLSRYAFLCRHFSSTTWSQQWVHRAVVGVAKSVNQWRLRVLISHDKYCLQLSRRSLLNCKEMLLCSWFPGDDLDLSKEPHVTLISCTFWKYILRSFDGGLHNGQLSERFRCLFSCNLWNCCTVTQFLSKLRFLRTCLTQVLVVCIRCLSRYIHQKVLERLYPWNVAYMK